MLHLMTNHINIIIIILLTIKIISSIAKQPVANKRFIHNAELYGNFTTIEFLKELEHFEPTYNNILIMQNQNATISSIFYTHLIKVGIEGNNNGSVSTSRPQRFGALSETAPTTFVNKLMDSLQVPVLQLNELQSFYLKRHYSEHLLSIVYIDINIEGIQMTLNDHKGLLEKLSRNLLHMTTSKVMFLLNFPWVVKVDGAATAAMYAEIDEDVVQAVLEELFHHCWQQKIINVVALLADYQATTKFYSYTHFPTFQLQVKKIELNSSKQSKIYPHLLRNLKGYKIPIAIGGSDPRIVSYTTLKGAKILGGFIGHFISAFAKKYNCTLVQALPYKPHDPLPSKDLVQLVRNGTIEFSAGIISPGADLVGFTYPIQLVNWCIMLPVESSIPSYKFFTLVFKGETFLLVIATVIAISMVLTAALYLHGYHADFFDIICHDDCFRGILGQPFSQVRHPPKIIRFIYLKICVLGILLTTSYTSLISTYVTSPPREALLKTFDDVLWSGLKIVVWEAEYISMGVDENYKKYRSIFHFVQDYQEFLDLRNSLNTKYGYVMPDTKWDMIREQQKIFTTPLFRISNDLCLIPTIPMSFPVHENSLYTPLINRLILEAYENGFLRHWLQYSFLELVIAKKLKLEDLSSKQEFQPMTIADFQYIMLFLSYMFVFVNLVFMCEQLLFYRKRISDRLSSAIRRMASKTKNKLAICEHLSAE